MRTQLLITFRRHALLVVVLIMVHNIRTKHSGNALYTITIQMWSAPFRKEKKAFDEQPL